MRLSSAGLLAFALIQPAFARAQLVLNRPDVAFAEPFTAVRGLRELPDGRVLVSDFQDKVVQLVDLRAGTATKIGREGQGPEEYAMPASLHPLPDGGALLQDFGNRRFLPIGPDGTIGKAIPPPQPPATSEPGRGGGFLLGSLMDARGADRQGRLYFQGLVLPIGGQEVPDSVPIMRWDRARTIDTVAWLPVTEDMRPQVTRTGGNTAMTIRIGGGQAWPAQVQWGVAGDGRIALVNPQPYRVTWLSGRRPAAGPEVPFTAIKVTEADKKEYREQRLQVRPAMMAFTTGGGGAGARPAAPPPTVRSAGQDEPVWPATKPPFTGRDAVRVTPEGEVWVERTRAAGDATPKYDRFDATGQLLGQVALRPRSRVVGFGAGTVYVVRTDEDDLQYLERYRR